MKRSDLFTRGSVAIMTGLIAVPLIAMTGAAIDLSRVWLVKSRLQTSLDAAVLVVARDLANNGTSVAGLNLFWANFGRSTSGGFLGANATTPVVVQAPGGVSGSVQLTSSATLDQVLLGVMGIGQVTVGGTSIAQTAAYGLELALVLDNTGSMAGSSITSLITASNQLLNIVYGGADTQPHLWVSVVPFAAAVNIGNTHTGWLAAGSLNPAAYAPSSWMGCVMARTAATGAQDGDDFNDKKPIDARFQPFLYQSTYHQYTYTWQTGSGRNRVTHTYYYPGDNDWQSATWTSTNNEPDSSNNSVGPNLDCPSQPILPETASQATVRGVINSMVPVYRGGTIISLGLQAGWFTLSPTWQGLWGTPADPQLGAMPLAYNTPYMKKVIVLMTDGNNQWYDWPDGVPGDTPPTAPVQPNPVPVPPVPAWTADNDADFTAYGRLTTNTRGVAPANITTTLNGWMSTMCTNIKANNIIIYTILFNNTDSATATLFQNCASPGPPTHYFNSPTGTALQSAFTQIGHDLSSLRLAQ